METIWDGQLGMPKGKTLTKGRYVENLVIGAGMAGILTAYLLKKQGREVIVVEAKKIASGQTGRTTAKITAQHGMIYDNMIRKIGRKRAGDYARANEEAIRSYEQIIEEEGIRCHFKRCPAYLYTLYEKNKKKLQREAQAAASLSIAASFVEGKDIKELPFGVNSAVRFDGQAQFHPTEFISHLAAGLEIYENTKVLSVRKHTVFTNHGKIEAGNIIFATHYPFVNVPGFYFLRQHQERSYVLAFKGQKELAGMYYSVDENGLSLRSVGGTLLVGGGAHRTGKIREEKGYLGLRKAAYAYYPAAQEAGAWSAQDCMSHDEIPLIGSYSFFRPYWYVATGFKKWGMTSSMIAAKIISGRIKGRREPYEGPFLPQRIFFRASFVNFFMDLCESVCGLGKGIFSKRRHRCCHMGCRLEWNPQEGSRDCPCHGSRFGRDGEILDNPAQKDLKQ